MIADSDDDAAHLRHRLELIQTLTVSGHRFAPRNAIAGFGSIKKNKDAISHAAANIAVWRTYLPDDCVAAMINSGWHWST